MDCSDIIDMEARLLQWICRSGEDASVRACDDHANSEVREQALRQLRSYSFESAQHQVFFNCLSGIARCEPALIRELLSARLVRAGYPDVDFAPLFHPHGLTESKAIALLGQLLALRSRYDREVPAK